MECIKCGFDLEDWKDITDRCYSEIKITSTEPKLGYIVLSFISGSGKNVELGSFSFEEKFTPYNSDETYFVDENSINKKTIKVMHRKKGYFKVLLRP